MSTIFYITRDIERAAGLLGEPTPSRSGRGEFYVITNPSPLAEALEKKYNIQVLIINHGRDRSRPVPTIELIRSEYVQKKILEISKDDQPNILVFKTSPQIEKECRRLGWRLLNPPYEVGAVLEEKVMQYNWLRDSIATLQNDNLQFELPQVWTGQLFSRSYKELSSALGEHPIVQFNRGHTGLGTLRLESEAQWKELQRKFPKREVKVVRWYEGRAYTVNAVVISQKSKVKSQKYGVPSGQSQVITGRISEQLTGIPGCANNPYATVGNDWSSGSQLPQSIRDKINRTAVAVGNALRERGYRGLFGIDVIVTEKNEIILIEVNPRQPASATMEAQLRQGRGEMSVMEWHVMALTQNSRLKTQNYGVPLGRLGGFQLFFRNTHSRPVTLMHELNPGRYEITGEGLMNFIAPATSVREIHRREFFAFSASKYANIPPGGEVLRMQSKFGMMDTFGSYNIGIIGEIGDAIPYK